MVQFSPNAWRTSSRSTQQGQCVEVAITSAAVGVRDSKDRATGHFTVAPDQWSAFTARVKAGSLDL